MRQLKFRVWDKVEKRFIEEWNPDPKLSWDGTIYCYERRMKDGKYVADELTNERQQNNQLVIQRYTGLKDKNDKEIYEGDLCKAQKSNSYLNGVYEVAWHETKGRWYYKNQPTYKDLYQVGCAGNLWCEVVGNVFEGKS